MTDQSLPNEVLVVVRLLTVLTAINPDLWRDFIARIEQDQDYGLTDVQKLALTKSLNDVAALMAPMHVRSLDAIGIQLFGIVASGNFQQLQFTSLAPDVTPEMRVKILSMTGQHIAANLGPAQSYITDFINFPEKFNLIPLVQGAQ